MGVFSVFCTISNITLLPLYGEKIGNCSVIDSSEGYLSIKKSSQLDKT